MKYLKRFNESFYDEQLLDKLLKDKTFINWFKGSEMVESNGKLIIFYHGSKNKFDSFDKKFIGTSTDDGWLGEGFYFYTDPEQAIQYGDLNAYILNIENCYFATKEENDELAERNDPEFSKSFSDRLKSEGYDGVYYNGDLRGETVVFEPEQIWKI